MKFLHTQRRAFTLIEFLVVIAFIAIMAVFLLPTSHKSGVKVDRAQCASNMKQVALAFVVWANDSEKAGLPWWVEFANGGTRNHPSDLRNNAWFQYSWVSNELLNPKVLACPSDKQAKPAETFTASAQGGFLHPNYQNEACSYNLGLEAGSIGTTTAGAGGALLCIELSQEHLLLSDRNLNTSLAESRSCSSGLNPIYGMTLGSSQWLRKPDYGHGIVGNVSQADGSVQMTGRKEFNEIIAKSTDGSASPHCLQPRPNP